MVDLGAGNDQLVVFGSAADAATTISIETGTGDDRVYMTETNTGADVSISNEGGNDVRRISETTLGGLDLNGAGSSALENSVVNGNLASNSNGVSNIAVAGTRVTGSTSLNGSGSGDTFVTSQSIFDGLFDARGNGGRDVLALASSEFNSAVVVAGDAGNDILGARRGNTFAADSDYDGGQGDDVFASDNQGVAPAQRRIESSSNTSLDGLIDLALSDFDGLLLDL